MEVHPLWYLSEQDLLVWFHNKKFVDLGVITDMVLTPNTTEKKDVGNVAFMKPYRPVAF